MHFRLDDARLKVWNAKPMALHVTAANEQDRSQVGTLPDKVQAATGDTVEVEFIDQEYPGAQAAQDA